MQTKSIELELNSLNRERIIHAFANNLRVDLAFDCFLEGTAGKVMVDDAVHPRVFRLEQGSFWYFAGDAASPSAKPLLMEMPANTFLMPSPPEWIDLAKSLFGRNLTSNPRFCFSGDTITSQHLESLLEKSRFTPEIQPIDQALAQQMVDENVYLFDISGYASAADFTARGLGYCLSIRGKVVAGAYSALSCSKGVEVSVYVEDRHRQRGIATALCARLVRECLRRGWIAHWDAANPESCKLAQKLGYRPAGEYTGYFLV